MVDMIEVFTVLAISAIIVAFVGLVYKPARVLIADLLFAVACFFGAFFEFFKHASHDARNFDPKTGKVPDAANLPQHFNCRSVLNEE